MKIDFIGFLPSLILNIKFATGRAQVEWINTNLKKIWDFTAQQRLAELRKAEPDIGEYLWREGRNAIAHANADPILDPDIPTDRTVVTRDADLMQGIAEVFIQEEMGVPSQRKIWHEHLYELEGFKRLFGVALTARLKLKESAAQTFFPSIPPLTLKLKEQPPHNCLTALPFRVAACKDGIVLLATDPTAQPMSVALALNFPEESLELVFNMFGVNYKNEKYTKRIGACYYKFLIGYFCKGCLEVFNAATGDRLSHKTAFIPINVDLRATVDEWQKKIVELETANDS
jgi:hypothetical protein